MTDRRIVLKLDIKGNAEVYGYPMPHDVDVLVYRALERCALSFGELPYKDGKYELRLLPGQATTHFNYDGEWFVLMDDRMVWRSNATVKPTSIDAARSIYLCLIAWAREVISDLDPYEAHRLRLQALRIEPRMAKPADPPPAPPQVLCAIEHEDFV